MTKLKGKKVLITGGASGIGKLMAKLILEREAQVVLWDIDLKSLEKVLAELSPLGAISGYQVDISKLDQIREIAIKTKEEIGIIDVLINNAGIVAGKFFYEHSSNEIEDTMSINTNAPMHITKAFLGDMMAQNSGHICNIASSGGLISNPKMSVYAASKWAMIGWSDSLRLEMKQLKKNVAVTTIMPYYIHTGMFDGVRSKIPILKPEAASLKIVKAIERNKKSLTIPGYIYRITRIGQGILPGSVFDWFAGDILGIYKTMEYFTGRKN